MGDNREMAFSKIESSETYQKIKQWYNLYSQHKYIDPHKVCHINQSKAPVFYRLFIKEINNINPASKLTIDQNNSVAIRVFMTFFNSSRKRFYGRTYFSRAIPVTKDGNYYRTVQPINVYFHSMLDKGTENILTCEVEVLEMSSQNLPRQSSSIGWGTLKVFDQGVDQAQAINLIEGTPRILTDPKGQTNSSNTSTSITFQVLELDNFKNIVHLLHESILCGQDDILPGIVGRQLPDTVELNIQPPRLENTTKVFFEKIQLDMPRELEDEILRSAAQYRRINCNVPDTPQMSSCFIEDRRLLLVFHNTWTAVNSNGFRNYAHIKNPNPSNQNADLLTYHYDSALECDGVFGDQFALLMFQLDYYVSLPLPNNRNDTWHVVVAFAPQFVSSVAGSTIIIKERMIVGPGRSASDEKLYEFNSQNANILLQGKLNLSGVRSTQDQGSYSQAPTQQYQPQQTSSASNDEAVRLQMQLNEKNRELERMRAEQEQRMREMEAKFQSSQGQGFQPPQQTYQQPLSQTATIPKEFYDEQSRVKTDVQTIKDMLLDIQTQNRIRDEEERKRFEASKVDIDEIKNLKLMASQMSPAKQPTVIEDDRPLSSQYFTREISRADKALLVQSGIRGLMDNVGDYAGMAQLDEDKALHHEFSDKNLASVIMVQFLSIKPSSKAIFRDSIKPLDLAKDNFELPNKVFFTYNFFNFETTKTDSCVLEKPKESQSNNQSLAYGIPYYLVREAYLKSGTDAKEPIFKYEVDPSLKGQQEQHKALAQYFFNKSLTIDIWDADSLLLFGSVKVPLRDLLRQGKQVSTVMKEFDIIDGQYMRSKGGLQVLLKNVGKPTAQEMPHSGFSPSKTGTMTGGFTTGKKKVKSKTKVNLPEHFKTTSIMHHFDGEEITNPDQRKQERISRYKLAAIQTNTNALMTNDEFEKERSKRELREISNFRDTKKLNMLKTSLNNQYSDDRTVMSQPGKVEIIPIEVANHYEYESVFSIHIDDPDEAYLGKSEFSVVTNPTEWKYWVEKRNYSIPPEWSLFTVNSNSFVLKSGERVEILVKYLTMRNYNKDFGRDMQAGNIPENDIRRKSMVATRTVHVSASHSNGRIMNGVKIQLVPSPPVIDHTFRFFEQENKSAELLFPAIYQHSIPPANKPVLRVNYQNAIVEWLNDYEMALQLKIPSNQSVLRFNVLAYNDVYHAELLANWAIEIRACAGMDAQISVGQLTTLKLAMPSDMSRRVRVYHSHPSLGYFPDPYDKEFTTVPGSYNTIPMNVRSFDLKPTSLIVNAVDTATKELVYSWVVKLIGSTPQVTHKYEIEVKCGYESQPSKVLFENRSTSFCLFEFVSSHPELLQPIEKTVPFEGGEKKNIKVRVTGRKEPGIAEVCLYASDTEEKVANCLLFQIKYIN